MRSAAVVFSSERRLAPAELLFGGGQALGLLARHALGLHARLVSLFLGLEQHFLFPCFGVAFGVLQDAHRLFFGAPDRFGGDTFAVGDPVGEDGGGGHRRNGEIDEIHQVEAHSGPFTGSECGISGSGFGTFGTRNLEPGTRNP